MTNHPNRSKATAMTYPLHRLAAELDGCSPQLRDLLRMALAGANGESHAVTHRDRLSATLRLNEAVTMWTKEAKAARAAVQALSDVGNAVP